MSRKDYVLIADALKLRLKHEIEHATYSLDSRRIYAVLDVVVGMADALADENPRFSRKFFYSHIGVEDAQIAAGKVAA